MSGSLPDPGPEGGHPGPGATGRPLGAADLVVVGASAGGGSALEDLVAGLAPTMRAAVLVVLHVPATGVSVVPDVLRRAGAVDVDAAVDRMPLRRGRVLVAPQDRHLLVDGATVRLSRDARVNGHRPAIDPLFESAARAFGPRVLGVLLSGTLDDGVAGLGAIREAGGVAAVQDPDEAAHSGMPRAAIAAGVVDHVLPVAALRKVVSSTIANGSDVLVPDGADDPADVVGPEAAGERIGDMTPSAMACPHCGGTLWEGDTGGVPQYECRVGHRYSPDSLFHAQADTLDDALWAAHRALLEQADLARRMARRMRRAGSDASALRYDRTAGDADRRAEIVHEALMVNRQIDPDHDAR